MESRPLLFLQCLHEGRNFGVQACLLVIFFPFQNARCNGTGQMVCSRGGCVLAIERI